MDKNEIEIETKNELLKDDKEKAKNKNAGHRKRLKKRFVETGFEGLAEHEILELILFYAIPYKDTKDLAKSILEEYGTIANLFESDVQDIVTRTKVSEHTAILISLIFSTYKVYLKSKDELPILKSASAVNRYLKTFYVGTIRECFYVICLDAKKKLIKTCLISEGSATQTQIYVRNIIECVLKNGATQVILTHNHPSGKLTPSFSDVESTKQIVRALNTISVKVLDHIIVCDDNYFSFSQNGLLKQ